MTHTQWTSCKYPEDMLDFLLSRGRAGERKLHLFAVACVRRAWEAVEDGRSRRVIEVTERYADGLATAEELASARSDASYAARAGMAAGYAALYAASPDAVDAARANTNPDTTYYDADVGAVYYDYSADRVADYSFAQAEAWSGGRGAQADLLRDIFGNPFRPRPRIERAWLTWNEGIVSRLAEATYEHREMPGGTLDNARLSILADALQEAGCDDNHLLGHLRSGGLHVRGCHALDAVLGKS